MTSLYSPYFVVQILFGELAVYKTGGYQTTYIEYFVQHIFYILYISCIENVGKRRMWVKMAKTYCNNRL